MLQLNLICLTNHFTVQMGCCSTSEPHNESSEPTIISAAWHGKFNIVKQELDQGADIEVVHGAWTPLLCTIARSHHHITKLLLNRKASVNRTTEWWNPLHCAVQHGNPTAVNLLLDRK